MHCHFCCMLKSICAIQFLRSIIMNNYNKLLNISTVICILIVENADKAAHHIENKIIKIRDFNQNHLHFSKQGFQEQTHTKILRLRNNH